MNDLGELREVVVADVFSPSQIDGRGAVDIKYEIYRQEVPREEMIRKTSQILDFLHQKYYTKLVEAKWSEDLVFGDERMAGELLDDYYGSPDEFRGSIGNKDEADFIYQLTNESAGAYILALIQIEDKTTQSYREKLGMLIRLYGTATISGYLMDRIENSKEPDDSEYKLKVDLLRDVLGYPDIEEYYVKIGKLKPGEKLPLVTNLGQVYEKYDFSLYPVSERTEKFRTQVLGEIFKSLGIDPETSRGCDAGCGTGWLLSEMQKLGFRASNLFGVEIDDTNIRKAEQLNPGIKIFNGTIQNMWSHFWREKLDWITVLGRTATHAGSWAVLGRFLNGVSNSLKDGGYLFVDFPDPKAKGGVYEEYGNRMKQAYKRHGFSDEELEDMCVLVDGPAARGDIELFPKYLFPRLVPNIDAIKKRVGDYGYDIVREVVEELPNGTGVDKNILLVLKIRPFDDDFDDEDF